MAHAEELNPGRELLTPLMPNTALIRQHPRCRCHPKCWQARWKSSRARDTKDCVLCSNSSRARGWHSGYGPRVVQQVHAIDQNMSVYPEFMFKTRGMGRGAPRYADLLFVLSSGKLLVVELDGKSHRNANVERADKIKETALKSVDVEVWRVSIVDSIHFASDLDHLSSLVQQLLHDDGV